MGFDLIPQNKDIDEERFVVWCWRPLWNFVHEHFDQLTEKDFRMGQYNDKHLIGSRKAKALGLRLFELLEDGTVKRYLKNYQKRLDSLPDVTCQFCCGTGRRNNEFVKGKCNVCHGTGQVRPSECEYSFDVEAVESLAEFAIASKGFRIS